MGTSQDEHLALVTLYPWSIRTANSFVADERLLVLLWLPMLVSVNMLMASVMMPMFVV
jgi:hypothetical protein